MPIAQIADTEKRTKLTTWTNRPESMNFCFCSNREYYSIIAYQIEYGYQVIFNMRTHSILSGKCSLKRSSLGGYGVFAVAKIKKGELICVWGGIAYSYKEICELSKKHPHYATNPISVYDGYYLGPVNKYDLDDGERFNHSCDPNAGVKGQIILVARRDIKKGEEICFDYDTTETCDEGSFKCKCGAKNCREVVDGSSWKKPQFQKKNRGYLSWYIEEKIRKINSGNLL